MKTVFKILLALLCSCALPMQAQQSYNPVMPDVIPPSPTSRVFQKFLGYPISHATGTIDINIPLYTLETNGLSIPLALKYHSSGVRVQDPVGVVGRNWALFPGFKISRTIMSKPDELYPVTDKGYYPSIEDQICLASPISRGCECRDDYGHIYPKMDGQYDIFQLNMSGITASFILQRINGVDVVKQIPDSPLKVTPRLDPSTETFNYSRLYGFEVQDDKGIRYIFGEVSPVRNTSTNFLEYQSGGYICGWMLREIVFPNNTKITFTYQTVQENVQKFSDNVTILDDGQPVHIGGCYWDDMRNESTGSDSPYWRILGWQGYKLIDGSDPTDTYVTESLVPSTIVSPSATISFTYLSEKLASLTVKQATGEQLKKVQLTYDDTNRKDLLKKVDITGEGCYQLTYKKEGLVKNPGFDWWGYYNGSSSHRTYLPSITLPVNKTVALGNDKVMMNVGYYAERTPNPTYMDTHALVEMVSPTKGKLKITYEPHRFMLGGVEKVGGGLRVKSAELYDPVSEKTIVKNYVYEQAHFLDHDYPDAKSMISTRYICLLDDGTCTVRQRTLSVFANSSCLRRSANVVWYSKITETADDWKKEYKYGFEPDEYENMLLYSDPFNPEYLLSRVNSMLYPAPWLVSETIFQYQSAGYEKVQETEYSYSRNYESISGMVAISYKLPMKFPMNGYSSGQFLNKKESCYPNTYVDAYGSPVKYSRYYIAAGSHRLSSTQKTTYCTSKDNNEGGDKIVEKVHYDYDAQRPYNISVKRTSLSGGDEHVEKYYYSNNTIPDIGTLTAGQQSAIAFLTSRNYLTTCVQQTLEKGNARLYSILKGYSNSLSPAMEVQDEYCQQGSSPFAKRITYNKYDSYRNPIHISKDNQEHIVYLWSYKGQYSVAEIKGVTYEEVQVALGCTPESLSLAASPNMTLINGLRQKLASALITTYTYKPIVGVTTVTAPNGTTTTFEYNSEGKLLRMKDQNGKTVEEYQYNFQS